MNVWEILDINETHDLRAIKRAYSSKLKVTRPDDDARAYQELREAFDLAKRLAKQIQHSLEQQESEGVETVSSGEPESQLGLDAACQTATITESLEAEVVESSEKSAVVSMAVDSELNQQETLDANTSHEADTLGSESLLDEPLADKNNLISEKVIEMVQAVHDCLNDKGEVAAVALFRDHLESPELFSLDWANRFESQMMHYLDWWAGRPASEEGVILPLGLMRQVVNHYEWHKGGASRMHDHPALEQRYESIINDSGLRFLQKVERKELSYTPEFSVAAKRLLGAYKPKRFSVYSVWGESRKAIDILLSRVEEMNDASLDFELNTRTVNWWLARRTQFPLSAWMIIIAALFAVSSTGPTIIWFEGYLATQKIFVTPLSFVVVFLLVCVLVTSVIYCLAYGFKITSDILRSLFAKLNGKNRELVFCALAVSLYLVADIVAVNIPDSAPTSYIVATVFLTAIYQTRLAGLVMSAFLIAFGFHLDGVGDMLSQVATYKIIYPVLAINTALFYGYLDFKSKQLKRDFTTTEIPSNKRLGLELLLISSCFGYSLLFL